MAGIGFVLQKLVRQQGLSGLFRAMLAGAVIVAGPWLASVAGMGIISAVGFGASPDDPRFFTFAIVLCYIASLVAFGGYHYLFSRSVADFVYLKKRADAAQALVASSIVVGLAAAALGAAAAALTAGAPVARPLLYGGGMVALFVAVNLGWLLMLFSSLARRYFLLLAIYSLGMAASVAAALLLAPALGSGGALAGFAAGQALLCAALYAMAFAARSPKGGSLKAAFRSLAGHLGILAAGTVFTWGFWADKVAFWFFFGQAVPGTPFALYDRYDVAVFNANLSTIPGLVYFVIATETGFFRGLRGFIKSAQTDVYRNLQLAKYRMVTGARRSLAEQSLLQAAVAAALIVLLADPLAKLAVAGAACYLFLLTLVVFLFYFQAFFEVLAAGLVFLLVNGGTAVAAGLLRAEWAVGWGFLAAAALASAVAFIFLDGVARRYDRVLFLRSSVRTGQLSPMYRRGRG